MKTSILLTGTYHETTPTKRARQDQSQRETKRGGQSSAGESERDDKTKRSEEMKIRNVLSVFNGMSCGNIALDKAGIEFDNYYSSEVDKYAIQVTQANYPNTIQLGDVTKWREWGIDWSTIDLFIGGSPCQGFSFAGKQLAFDDPRSKLFFEFVEILNHIKSFNPNVRFMLENVRMKKGYLEVINRYLGVEPIFINSSLVSAQNRVRIYWSNWPVNQPKDQGVALRDIMLENTDEYVKVSKKGRYKKFQNKDSCFTAGGNSGGNHSDMELLGVAKNRCYHIGEALGINGHDLIKRIYADYGKSPTVTCITGGNQYSKIAVDDYMWRRLTVRECARLQTVPEQVIDVILSCGVSNSQLYKMIGNGWTVDIIAHIFSTMDQVIEKRATDCVIDQLEFDFCTK